MLHWSSKGGRTVEHFLEVFFFLKQMPQQPQQQCSAANQMTALIYLADHFGLTVARDYLVAERADAHRDQLVEQLIDMSVLAVVPRQPTMDGNLFHQMRMLWQVAVRFGLYDAGDYVRERMPSAVPADSLQ